MGVDKFMDAKTLQHMTRDELRAAWFTTLKHLTNAEKMKLQDEWQAWQEKWANFYCLV